MQLTQASASFPVSHHSSVYDDPSVVSHYSALEYLTPCEQLLFQRYIKPGSAVLDLGVGGGRTTPYLAASASAYVGLDRSVAMIHSCRGRFPEHDFRVADAVDLSQFHDNSFDAIVMAFNSLDYVLPGEHRARCLSECRRVLKPGGVLIFSSHNPRSVIARLCWNPRRVEQLCARLCRRTNVFFGPLLCIAQAARRALALMQSIVGTIWKLWRAIPCRTFWRGAGCFLDQAHGGIVTHCWIPDRAIEFVSGKGFQVETYIGNDYPEKSGNFVTDWFYYVFFKQTLNEKPCA